MQLNVAKRYQVKTHGDALAFPHVSTIQQLRRSVLSCLLWESEFYESGQEIAERIETLTSKVTIEEAAALAIEARSVHNLRHVPLLLLSTLAKRGGPCVGRAIAETIQRPDELAEFLKIYWRNGKTPLAKQVKKGLALAFRKFDAYSLAKYNRDGDIKLRDVLFLVHAKPKDEEQAALWKNLVDNKLTAPDTWEVELSAGKDKRATFERLLREEKLGYLAVLRNLRNMASADVDADLMRNAILARKGAKRVLPFRYVAAARACPQMEPTLDQALSEAIADLPILPGRTIVMVDVSRSMEDKLSSKSDLSRLDAAAALASLINGDVRMFSFSDHVVEVPPRRGMAGVDAIINSQQHHGTLLFDAVENINKKYTYDRLIVITDEQATNPSRFGTWIQGSIKSLPNPVTKGYMINVASNKNGVGYGAWTHIDGFSEGVLRWIYEIEGKSN